MKLLLIIAILTASLAALNIEREVLENGITVLSIEAHKIPVVDLQVVAYAGSYYDPRSMEGIANLTCRLLMRGTTHRSADDISRSLESVGGELNPAITEDYAGLKCRVLSKDLSEAIDLISDCFMEPLFDIDEFERVKKEVLSSIKVENNDPFQVSEKAYRKLLFGDNPLNHLPTGFEESVSRIGRNDVEYFYSSYYRPGNLIIVVVGDFVHSELLSLLNQKFGKWENGEISKPVIQEYLATDHPIGRIVPMDISQAYILLGHHGPKYGTEDWFDARVMNYILGGGGLTSRISMKIRDEKGLAYIAYCYFERFLNGGLFISSVQTRKEMAGEVVRTLVEEMDNIHKGARAGELEQAKKYYTGHHPLSFDTYGELLSIALQIEVQGLGLDYLDKFTEYIDEVSLEDIKNAAQKYIHPDRYYVVVVGNVKPEEIGIDNIEWLE
ncbi:hypothetical protein A2Y85_08160 [candidate division WOR-3 bacterium RBG_13_43_14]|uniref:Insulinase family protein n=1 Tax=candidate division WOR-3 bacterium RBG_13_43_14 TaxID=1802590 RepID=A0A1F4U6U7_UNCW3|nr:MAG: hypothetical protein A2Y85_08160 [candidate division WOR-3 bacterium RBG_13_43_14]